MFEKHYALEGLSIAYTCKSEVKGQVQGHKVNTCGIIKMVKSQGMHLPNMNPLCLIHCSSKDVVKVKVCKSKVKDYQRSRSHINICDTIEKVLSRRMHLPNMKPLFLRVQMMWQRLTYRTEKQTNKQTDR